MADVIVIGGGIVGTSAAWQLAELGAEVTLLERGALASGATARSQGLLLPPDHAELQPVFDETLRLYRRLADETGVDFALDAEPIGTLMLATARSSWTSCGPGRGRRPARPRRGAARGAGAGAARRRRAALPGRLPHRPGRADGRGGERRAGAGATIHTHTDVKRVGRGRVVTDAGTYQAATVLVCAGAWTRTLARALGHDVQVRPVRGWLAVTAPSRPLLRHVIYEAGYEEPAGPQPGGPVTVGDLAEADLATAGAKPSHAFAAHQNADGTIMIGATRSAALRETDESADALRLSAAAAVALIPALADARGGDHLDRPAAVLARRPALHRLAGGRRRRLRRARQRGRADRRRIGPADCADRRRGTAVHRSGSLRSAALTTGCAGDERSRRPPPGRETPTAQSELERGTAATARR